MCEILVRPCGLISAVFSLSAGKDHWMHPLWMQRMFWLNAGFGSLCFFFFLEGIRTHLTPPLTCSKRHCLISVICITSKWLKMISCPNRGQYLVLLLFFLTQCSKGGHTEGAILYYLQFCPFINALYAPHSKSKKLRLPASGSGLSFQLVIPTECLFLRGIFVWNVVLNFKAVFFPSLYV